MDVSRRTGYRNPLKMDETDDGLGAKWDEISTKAVAYYLVIPGLRAGQWLVLVGYDDQEEKCESPMNER
jgi:hypothetical protein